MFEEIDRVLDEFIGEETAYPLPKIVTSNISREVEKIIKSFNINDLLKKRDYIRHRLIENKLLRKIPKYTGYTPCLLALDTGFTSPPLELTGGRLIVIIRSHIFQNCRLHSSYNKSDKVGFIKFTDKTEFIATPLSKIYEREFIRNVLKDKVNGKIDVDVIVLDGELFPRTPPGYRARSTRGDSVIMRMYDKIVHLTDEILELADKTDTALIGIVKRSYGRDIMIRLMEKSLTINDKALATFILEPMEWISLGTYGDISRSLKEYMNKYRDVIPKRQLRSLRERQYWIEAVIEKSVQAINIRVGLYKASNPTFFSIATKIEFWSSNYLFDERLISYISSITGINGVPHPIDLVDAMSIVKPDLLHIIQQQLFSELVKSIKDRELALSIAGITNPEKMYKIGFK